MTPYTIEAVKQIRLEVAKGAPPQMVMAAFGWQASFFNRVCAQHGIEVAPQPECVESLSGAKSLSATAAAQCEVRHTEKPPRKHIPPIDGGWRLQASDLVYLQLAISAPARNYLEHSMLRTNTPALRVGGALIERLVADGRLQSVEILEAGEVYRRESVCVGVSFETRRRIDQECLRRRVRPARLVASLVERHVASLSRSAA